MRSKDHQLEFDFRQHGGKRKGAGRKPKNAEAGMPHRPRAMKKRGQPLLITFRLADGLPSLRRGGAQQPSIASIPATPVIASVAPASAWLLTTGWRRHGLLDIDELPQNNKHAARPRRNLADSSRRATSR